MAILGSILKKAIKLGTDISKGKKKPGPYLRQGAVLKKLLKKARNTEFGKYYHFDQILRSDDPQREFRKRIPVFDYNKIFDDWWHKTLDGKKNVCWPGKVDFFALSSGTSEASSKHIPITKDMIMAIRKTSMRQVLSLPQYDLDPSLFEKAILLIGGSTSLNKKDNHHEGDLTGINAGRLPFWFERFYKPGRDIASERNWTRKIDKIAENSAKWDIGIIVGVPAWIQITIEKVLEYNKADHIHQVWPNLTIYVHGGVSFEPYRKGFEKLLGKPLIYMETYLASEGYIAFQSRPETRGMELELGGGIFHEFIPFNEKNFLPDGKITENPETLLINEVEEGKDYALLLSTCAGTWRYLIGDTIRFTSLKNMEIVITGRTQHFLSLCGEHLSVENMNKAINMVSREMNISIPEYAASGIPHKSLFAHKWFLGTDDKADPEKLKKRLDEILMELNDDYRVERQAALQEVFVEIHPVRVFYDWMREKGKEGGQNKFPRVLNEKTRLDWEAYLRKTS